MSHEKIFGFQDVLCYLKEDSVIIIYIEQNCHYLKLCNIERLDVQCVMNVEGKRRG